MWYTQGKGGEECPISRASPGKEENAVAVSKSQQNAVHKYVKANYDRMELTVPKGRKELIKAVATAAGESVNQYIINAVDQRMSREAVGSPTSPADALRASLPSEASKHDPAVFDGRTEVVPREDDK